MNKTVAIALTVLLTVTSGFVFAQQPSSMRGSDAADADKAPEEKPYQGTMPGNQKPIARTFKGQPPLIPHALLNFDEITVGSNPCLDCHLTGEYKKGMPKIANSHLSVTGPKPTLNMARWQCNSCHVAQVDAKPLVENEFKGNVGKR